MKKTPLQQTRERFGSKDKLVEQIMGLIKRPANLTKDQLKKKLRAQSNKKLTIVLDREQSLKESFGGRDKLIKTLADSRAGSKKSEDKGYIQRLGKLSNGQLLDIARRRKIAS
ncbi:MAG TPA: hypothetical protein VM425_14400 [Myxococcota bacterium]|nr:hypothetical protein [Myxococcota bacterium]